MTIAEFIQAHMESLLEEWEEYAGTLLPAAEGMDSETLRNFAEGMLAAIVEDMQTRQTRGEQHAKSRGQALGLGPAAVGVRQATRIRPLRGGVHAEAARS